MLNNYETKIADTQEIFDQISRSLVGELQDKELHEVEETLFRSLEELNLPKQHFSYLLQQWIQMFCVDISHEKSRINIKEILGIDIWSGQTESINSSAASSVDSFYQNREIEKQHF